MLAVRPGVRSPVRVSMDYVIAVATTGILFGYLVYALLRPERF